jgi:hypothetical protein
VIPNYPGIEEHAMRFEAYRQRMPLVIATALVSNLAHQDILIHKTGDWGWAPSYGTIEQVMAALEQPESDFQHMPRTYALPDGSQAIIYARRQSPLLLDPPRPTRPSTVTFGNSARFLGFDLVLGNTTAHDQELIVTYYWESLAPTAGEYSAFVHFLDPENGEIVLQDDHPLFPRTYPSSMWQADRDLFERRVVAVPASFSGSELVLRLGLYSESERLPVSSAEGVLARGATYVDVDLVALDP